MTQARMTRLEFDNGLRMVREYLVTMTGTVTEAIQAATTALLDQNLEAVRATASLERELEEDRLLVEQCALQLIARERPVASELWMLVSAIKISAECWRMGLLAHHIGMAARHFCSAPAIPDEILGIFRRMVDVASEITDDARATLLTSDALDATRLEVDDAGWLACVVHFSSAAGQPVLRRAALKVHTRHYCEAIDRAVASANPDPVANV
jgi:phosphate transport system protein